MTFPRLRLRDEVASLLDLPWEQSLARWDPTGHRFRELPVGPSRHLVRFLVSDGLVYALKELPAAVAEREFTVLRHLEEAGLPAVRAVGLAERPERGDAILVTEYLRHSMQYRRLLMRLRDVSAALPRPAPGRDGAAAGGPPPRRRLLGRLLARQHAVPARRRPDPGLPRGRRDQRGPPGLSDGQRRFDLDILVENVAFGLADLAAYLGRPEDVGRRDRVGRVRPGALRRGAGASSTASRT